MIPIRYNVRSLVVRKRTSIATALGIALVVFVFAAALMLADGIHSTLGGAGSTSHAIVLRKGSQVELESTIEEDKVALLLVQPGIGRMSDSGSDGGPELVVVTSLEKLGTDGMSNVTVRGIPENRAQIRAASLKIVEGRAPKPGAPEAMIGARIRGRFRDLDLGRGFELRKNMKVEVVGVFDATGSVYESEVWTDMEIVRSAFRREGLVSSIHLRLEAPEKLAELKASVAQDKQLALDVLSEAEYYKRQSTELSVFVTVLATMITIFFAGAAMIGAMITMHAAVSSRSREIGTLRALGFSRFAVLISFLVEAALLSFGGGFLGTLAALMLGLVKISFMNWVTFSEVVFAFNPTPPTIITSLSFAVGMGLIGGFLPALRATRISPLRAIRN